MKNKQKNSGLFLLITRSYLMFMLVLLLLFLCVYKLWDWRTSVLFAEPQTDKLLSLPALSQGEYSKLPVARLLGSGGAVAVLDENENVLYSSSPDFSPQFTAGELSCISEYNSNLYISSMDYTSENGSKHYILTRDKYSSQGKIIDSNVMELDENYNILSGSWENGRSFYTQREYSLLTGHYSEYSQLYRYPLSNADGGATLLLRLESWNSANYEKALSVANRTWLLLIPLFVIAAALFVLWLNRKIKQPLKKLDHAITDMGEGRPANASSCGGPLEIRQIGENFDRLAQRLESSEQERKRLDEGRQTLIADISHDLKTPITVISGYARAINDGKVPPDSVSDYLKVIDNKASALTELINSFHEYSKVEHPEFTLACQKVELCEFIREYLAAKYDEIDLAGFTLEVSIPEQQVFCSLDAFQFRRALDNLLSNSLRHNTLGTVLFFDVIPGRLSVSLRLADNGRGIPPAVRGRIFEPFTVGNESRSGGGSGLGLAITKRIVEAHGGRIRLLSPSSPRRATEFEIELPILGENPQVYALSK